MNLSTADLRNYWTGFWVKRSLKFKFELWQPMKVKRANRLMPIIDEIWVNNDIASVFHWNVTIWLVMKWSHDYKREVSHPNATQIRTCTCLHDDVRCKQSMA
jgi:hypothetical protein